MASRSSTRFIVAYLLPIFALLILLLGLLYGGLSYVKYRVSQSLAFSNDNAINRLIPVQLGDSEQWIQIRGENQHNPILLFLHGGPGKPGMPFIRHNQTVLERHFVVVHWDQLGSGKSANVSGSKLTIDQLTSDALSLSLFLKKTFNRNKILLVGHGWGGYLGYRCVLKSPHHYYALFQINPLINSTQKLELGFRYATNAANLRENKKAQHALETLGAPPYPNSVRKYFELQKWILLLGGELEGYDAYTPLMEQALLSPHYSLFEFLKFGRHLVSTTSDLYQAIHQIRISPENISFPIPLVIFWGNQDFSKSIGDAYYQQLQAPYKNWLTINGARQFPHLENPIVFQKLLLKEWQSLNQSKLIR